MGSVASAQVTGAFLVERGVLTAAQLAEALELQRAQGGDLADILVTRFGLDRALVGSGGLFGAPRDIGEILLERGTVQPEQLEIARGRHRETGQPIGPILIEMGAITRMELASALAVQWEDRPARILPSPTARDRGSFVPDAPYASDDVDDLRFAMRALEASVRASRGQAGDDSEVVEELRLREQALADRVEALERAGAGALTTDPELVDLLARRLDTIEAQLASLGAHDTDAEAVAVARAESAALRGALDEIAARLDGMASAEGVEAALANLGEEIGSLGERMDGLARAVDDVAARPEVDPALAERVEDLTGRIHELTARPLPDPGLAERVDQLAGAVDELRARPEVDPVIAERVDDITGRVDELTSRPLPDPALAERVLALAAQVHELASRPQLDPELADRVDQLAGAVDELRARPEVDPALAERLESLSVAVDELVGRPEADPSISDRIDDLARRIDSVAVLAEAATGVEGLQEMIAGLTGRIDAVAESAGGVDRIEPALAELRAEVAELAGRPLADPDIARRVDELAERLEALATARVGPTTEKVAELDERVRGIASTAAAGMEALDIAVVDLRAAIAELGAPAPDPEIAARLDALADRVDALSSAPVPTGGDGDLDALARQVVELDARIVDLAGRVSHPDTGAAADTRVEGLEREVALLWERSGGASPGGASNEKLVELGTGFESLKAMVSELADTWAEERAALQARVDALSAPTPSGVGEDSAVLPSPAPAGSELAALAKEIERVSDRVIEQERSLVEHFSRREKAMLERLGVGGGELTQRVDQITLVLEEQRLRIEQLAMASGGGTGGGGVSAEELAALKDSLFGRLEKLASSLDWRFRRLEGEGEGDTATARDELATRVEELARIVAAIAPSEAPVPIAESGPTFLVLVPTAVGHQLIAIAGSTPATGDRLPSPLGGDELVVMGVGGSPLPGDERDCVFVEPASAPATA